MAYLDYTGASLFASSVLAQDLNRLSATVLGNPHSHSAPSLAATDAVSQARRAVLQFLGADDAEYAVIFTANASAACKLVGESFPFETGSALLLAADNHNSVVGMREFARARGATVEILPISAELRLTIRPETLPAAPRAPSLLAMPAQSNFSGVRHSLDLVAAARRRGWRVLLDAAAYLPTADLNLTEIQPDFLCLSLYKISGYPTGVGALVARREALATLRRPWFAGGTVDWVSMAHDRHRLTNAVEAFEDGSPHFLALGAVPLALRAVVESDRPRLRRHLARLTEALIMELVDACHPGGQPLVRLHGPRDMHQRGSTVSFTLLDHRGAAIPFWEVESAARAHRVAVRGGCFCNPGCAERAFGLSDERMPQCVDQLGDQFSIPAFATCMGDRPVGAVRVSMGLGSLQRDVEQFLRFVHTFARG
ncbi:MAG: aminotransferase class V-fold PLP-dependent enzyme [Gemmatimonadaceae bacterium]|nr:aminotransferase class V-fold PLP-dependent enzyme [Gemmatimonadaceae bacterium]